MINIFDDTTEKHFTVIFPDFKSTINMVMDAIDATVGKTIGYIKEYETKKGIKENTVFLSMFHENGMSRCIINYTSAGMFEWHGKFSYRAKKAGDAGYDVQLIGNKTYNFYTPRRYWNKKDKPCTCKLTDLFY